MGRVVNNTVACSINMLRLYSNENIMYHKTITIYDPS